MNIRDARLQLGLKQTELAEMLGVDAPLISKMESGVVLPNATMVETIEKALASHADALNGAYSINSSTELEKLLKTKINGYELAELAEVFQYTSAQQPITRGQLMVIWGTSDRAVRQRIEEMQNCGLRIINDGNGYYITRKPEEYERYRAREKSRARSIDRKIAAMDKCLPGQMVMGWDDIPQ